MVAQTQECLIEFIDKFMSLPVEKKFCFFKDDELLQNAINAVYIKVI